MTKTKTWDGRIVAVEYVKDHRGRKIRVGDLVRPLFGCVPADLTLDRVTGIFQQSNGPICMNIETAANAAERSTVDPARYVLCDLNGDPIP